MSRKSPPKSAPSQPVEAVANPELDAMLARALGKPGEAGSDEPEAAVPELAPVEPADQHCGFVAIVGKPNVGKSTLLNALVGQKVSITSRKAQTTRHRITGYRTVGPTQFVFVDTPGFQTRHGNALNRALNKTVLGAVNDVDLILFVVEAGHFNLADAKVLDLLPANVPVVLLANKFDLVHRRGDLAPWLRSMQERHAFAEFVPMSAKNTKDIQRLFAICEKYLPQQPWMHDPEELTDRSERFMASEMVREKLFRLTGDELPYTSTVIIDKFEQEGRLRRIAATIVVERDGHKGMVIGDKGEKLKRIGTEARQELEKLWDCKVFLELWVKVRSGWADDDARVRSFGYE
ncbi:MAG: GTPase Era [Betaproteobacteria bacterium HGW-Betaproteobacteria-9]|jgi:GTP-binding protein Era|nr:GTPase Era [Hydrogenophaga sp.]PKO29122.1 MAG: GTPase Era [Betaproteobacteria bacterium HGW-Betaproteobacteria-9]